MKTFKVIDGRVKVDGVLYGLTPNENVVMGKSGRIHSINIPSKGQYFPISGEFNDGTTPIQSEPPKVKGKLGKTELVEKSSIPVGIDGKPIKKSRKTK
jgi:hypothetical protein